MGCLLFDSKGLYERQSTKKTENVSYNSVVQHAFINELQY